MLNLTNIKLMVPASKCAHCLQSLNVCLANEGFSTSSTLLRFVTILIRALLLTGMDVYV